MVEKCCFIQSNVSVIGRAKVASEESESTFRECLRPLHHDGPHLIRRLPSAGSKYVLWERRRCKDRKCVFCNSKDPGDWCVSHQEITEDEAREYLSNPQLIIL